MTESKQTKILKRRRPILKSFNEKFENVPKTYRNFQLWHPPSVIQRIKPNKRNTRNIYFENRNENMNSISDYNEFNSDEHIENKDDWYDDLDVVARPHLLGPSATHYSPVPVEYQHLSDFPFSCQQISIECHEFKPIARYVPCSFPYSQNISPFQ